MWSEVSVKLAAARWQKLFQRGRLGAQELQRIEGAGGRAGMQAFSSPLSEDALARYRTLQQKLIEPYGAAMGIQPKQIPGLGPSTLAGQSYVDPDAGTFLRYAADPSRVTQQAGMYGMVAPGVIPEGIKARLRRPEDAGITRATQKHELAESAIFRGMMSGDFKPNFMASHLGPGPLLAERVGVQDPAVHQTFDRLRAISQEDASATRLLRQHGMVGNYVPPLGGRTHRTLGRGISQMPTTVQEGGARRLATGGAVPTEVTETQKWVDPALDLAERVGKTPLLGSLLGRLPEGVRGTAETLHDKMQRGLLGAVERARTDYHRMLQQPPTHLNMSPEERRAYIARLSALPPVQGFKP
mgnify:CR=1 FL=1